MNSLQTYNLNVMPQKKKEKKGSKQEQNAFDVVGLAGIEGLGFSSAAELHIMLGVNTVHDLYVACKEGKVAELPGWGELRQKKLKSSIELSVLWFKSQCKKKERQYGEHIAESMAKAVGIDSALMQEIAEAHRDAMENKEEDA